MDVKNIKLLCVFCKISIRHSFAFLNKIKRMYHLNSVKFLTWEIVHLNEIYQVTKFLKDVSVWLYVLSETK